MNSVAMAPRSELPRPTPRLVKSARAWARGLVSYASEEELWLCATYEKRECRTERCAEECVPCKYGCRVRKVCDAEIVKHRIEHGDHADGEESRADDGDNPVYTFPGRSTVPE